MALSETSPGNYLLKQVDQGYIYLCSALARQKLEPAYLRITLRTLVILQVLGLTAPRCSS